MKIYLDNNATTPVHPEVFEAMRPFLTEKYGNPSSIHWAGREVKGEIEMARRSVAALLGCSPREITFNSGGSEGNNTVLFGLARVRGQERGHIVTTQVEHASILDACRMLEKERFHVTYLPVDREGRVSTADFEASLRPDTFLAAMMLVNNEIGTVYPVREAAGIAQSRRIWFHCDAVQAAGKVKLDARELGVDSLSVSAHKFMGPKGTGALYVRRGQELPPLIVGDQENSRRGGTHNAAGIAGMGRAAAIILSDLEGHIRRLDDLGRHLQTGILNQIEGARLNGPSDSGRVFGTVNVSFPRVEGEAMLINLDLQGIAVSTGSACSAGSVEPSHVLQAMGLSEAESRGAVRFSIGRQNTREEIDRVLNVLPDILAKLWNLSGRAAA